MGKTIKSHAKYFAVLASAALLAIGCSAPSDDGASAEQDDQTQSVRVSTDGTMASAAIHLGVEQGFFDDVGLELEINDSPNPPAAVAALQSNEVDIGAVPTVPSIAAQSQGIELTSIAPSSGYPEDESVWEEYDEDGIYAQPDSGISSPADLEGKQVAVNARKAVFEAYVQDAVIKDGGDPNKIEWVALDFGSQLEALRKGDIDVATLPMPFTVEAEAEGAELLWAPGVAFYEGGLNATWLASPDMAGNTEVIDKFRTAILKSNEYANEHREETIEKASELTGMSAEAIADNGKMMYFPANLPVEDLEHISQKLADLGFIEEPVSMTDRVLWTE